MTIDELEPLYEVACLKFEQAQTALARVSAVEAQHRAKLDELDEMSARAALTDPESLQRLYRLGAQELWVKWARNKKSEINGVLAYVLAEKAERMADLRRALGRKEALAALLEDERKTLRKAQDAKRQESLLALTLIDGGTTSVF